jgi:hypothetical protein
MNKIRKFFGIEEDKYIFEWADLTTMLTVLNVAFVLIGFSWAPWVGIINCCVGLLLNIKSKTHLNMYVMQIALIILNAYFLTL